MRSTPCPKDILRTVNVSRAPPCFCAMQIPSNTWMRSLSPSLIFTWTLMVSPGLNFGISVRSCCFSTTSNAFITCYSNLFLQEIRSVLLRLLQGGFTAPFADGFVITRYQYFRYLPTPEFRGPRVMRVFDQLPDGCGIGERVSQDRFLFPHHTGDISGNSVNHNSSGNLAARKNKIADRNLRRCQMLDHAFVDAFITAANHDDLAGPGKPQCLGLCKLPSRSTKDDDLSLGGFPNRFDCFEDRLRLENHSFTTSKGSIIDGTMPIRGEVPQIMNSNLDQALLTTSPDYAKIEWALEELRKDRDDVKDHLF